jgi:prepilin peptidase CpaA
MRQASPAASRKRPFDFPLPPRRPSGGAFVFNRLKRFIETAQAQLSSMMSQLLPVLPFVGLLLVAAFTDLTTMQIPNWVSVALAALFPLTAFAVGMPLVQIGFHFLFGAVVLAICFALFQFNIVGGGDAKLIAAAAVWTGLTAFAPFAVWTSIAGGALALALLVARNFFAQAETRPAFVNRLLKPRGGVPYGVAIMTGGLMVLGALPFMTSALTLP